jgi:CubicO group peptidase (beta-lactamase class C family)
MPIFRSPIRGQLAVLIACISLAATVNAEDPALDPARLQTLKARMSGLVDDGRRVGIAWAVARDGQVLASGAHGYRDAAGKLPMTTDSIFRVYSMTRAVTAVALLQLVEQGKVDLDAPVSDYLPELAELRIITDITGDEVSTQDARSPVTVRQLLTYTAGFAYAPQYPESVGVDHRAILGLSQTPAQAMQKLASYPLRDAPGVRWRYGYHSDVLGALIETVSGQRIDDYYREHIFAPLGMNDTGFMVPAEQADRLVRAYGDGGTDLTDRLPPSSDYLAPTRFHSGGGGLVSTLADWAKFAAVLAGDGRLRDARLLEPETLIAMRSNQITAEQGPLFWYEGADIGQPGFSSRWQGYGWGYSVGVRLADAEHGVPGRAGEISWGGLANTNWLADPDSGLVAMVFAQYLGEDAPATDIAMREALFEPR